MGYMPLSEYLRVRISAEDGEWLDSQRGRDDSRSRVVRNLIREAREDSLASIPETLSRPVRHLSPAHEFDKDICIKCGAKNTNIGRRTRCEP